MSIRSWLPLVLAVAGISMAGATPMRPGDDHIIPIHPDSELIGDAVIVPMLSIGAAAEPDPAETLGLPAGSAVPMHATELVQALASPNPFDDRFGLARVEEPTPRDARQGRADPGMPCRFLRCLIQVGDVAVDEPVPTFADASRAFTARAAMADDGQGAPRAKPNERLSLAFLPDLHELALIGFVLLVLAGLAKRRS